MRELMRGLKFPKETARRYGLEFNAGRDSDRSFRELVAELGRALKAARCTVETAEAMVGTLCSLAAADRILADEEREMLLEAGEVLGVRHRVEAFFSDCSGEERRSRKQASEPASEDGLSLDECYSLLGIDSSVSDKEVKAAYRRKAMEFHPDHVMGAGLSEAFIEFAKEKFQKIGVAYGKICRARGIR